MIHYRVIPQFLTDDFLTDEIIFLCKSQKYEYYEHLEFVIKLNKPKAWNVKFAINKYDGIIGFNIFENHGKNTGENILSTQFIFVHPMYQNKGIGTELMNFKSKNLDLMNKQMKGYIERVECTKSSIRFFDKLGFKFKKLTDCKTFLQLEK